MIIWRWEKSWERSWESFEKKKMEVLFGKIQIILMEVPWKNPTKDKSEDVPYLPRIESCFLSLGAVRSSVFLVTQNLNNILNIIRLHLRYKTRPTLHNKPSIVCSHY